MPRILVCGCSGAGKTTFARKLVALTELPYISLDAHFWQPGWAQSHREDFRARMQPIIAGENWLIDGNYFSGLGDFHLARATHVFWFDLPRRVCMIGALTRIITGYGKTRPEMAPGCPEQFDSEFFRYIWTYNDKHRPEILERFKSLQPDQRLTTFTQRQAADATLARIAHEGLA